MGRPWRPSVAPAALLPLFRRAAVLRSFQQNDGVQYGRDELPLIMVQGPVSVFLAVVLAATAHGRLDGAAPEVFSEFDDYFSNLIWPLRTHEDLLFPTLTEEQRKFAVNPSYPDFSAPIVGDLTVSQDDDEESEGDEIVEDPFVSNEDFVPPKKASLKALLNEDPNIVADMIEDERIYDIYFTTIVGVTSGLMVFVIVGIGFLFHRARKNAKDAEDVEYPAYGVTGPGKDISPTSGDRKLAQNAQLYHYQHQKNQMIAFDGQADSQRRSMSDNESEDGEEGDYTVYECPGLAPTGEMEVRNPMFEDDVTPKATSK